LILSIQLIFNWQKPIGLTAKGFACLEIDNGQTEIPVARSLSKNAEYLESYNDDPNPDENQDANTVKREIPDWYLRIINQTIDEELPF
jgi:hypothetical protein